MNRDHFQYQREEFSKAYPTQVGSNDSPVQCDQVPCLQISEEFRARA